MTKQEVVEEYTLAGCRSRQTFKSGRVVRWGLTLVVGLSLPTVESWTRLGSAKAASDEVFPAGSRPAGYKLGLLATSCWMGGVWSDAEGSPRDTLAWTGLGQGFANRLRMLDDELPAQAVPELSRIMGGVATRLEAERRSAEIFTRSRASRSL
jgi:hypothetical protein